MLIFAVYLKHTAMKKQLIITAFILLGFTANAQLLNMDFENWDSTGVGYPLPDNWVIGQGTGQFGIYKDNNPQNGAYAMTLSRWYYYTFDDAVQSAPAPFKPAELSGYYRYTDNQIVQGEEEPYNDTAHVYVFATKWNVQSQQRDTLGQGSLDLHGAENWTFFNCPIYYTGNGLPDSVTILLAPTERHLNSPNGLCLASTDGYCSFFTVDNLSLSETVTSVSDKPADRFKLYPNPASDELYVGATNNFKTYGYFIYDAMGKRVGSGNLGTENRRVDITGLPSGLYTLTIYENYEATTLTFVKQ